MELTKRGKVGDVGMLLISEVSRSNCMCFMLEIQHVLHHFFGGVKRSLLQHGVIPIGVAESYKKMT